MNAFEKMMQWQKYAEKVLDEDFWTDFSEVMQHKGPYLNVYEAEKEAMIIMGLPGLQSEKDVRLSVDPHKLYIKGTLRWKEPEQSRPIQTELNHGNFHRTVDLPFPVEADDIKAAYENGLLTIRLTRKPNEEKYQDHVPVQYRRRPSR
ncbi:Hsp20/alpha crystallin family protein [Bacillus sp. FJAT-44742]|uniref:Hsp20/alpha crystallin family protein n=1 Tax=Bacillus sp. FJAT-44742 TaxID=2014005 RepID=UPI000C244A06|nr:Hsp20/alpha crystallin family protein [Bacillus sp. FJAT-44742]